MKFSVLLPLLALLPAFILALLTLLAGIQPKFLPDAYIVRTLYKAQPPSNTNTTARLLERDAGPIQVTSVMAPPTLPTHRAVVRDTPAKEGPKFALACSNVTGNFKNEPNSNLSGICTATELPPAPEDNNQTEKTPNRDQPAETNKHQSGYSYSLHLLTSCERKATPKTANCTKPWDFQNYFKKPWEITGQTSAQEHRGPKDLRRRDEEADRMKFEGESARLGKELAKMRPSFARVHVVACVFLGLSLLCTAISFFILPALGQWISIGNLALATLATIFLVTSSISTAALAHKVGRFVKQHTLAKRFYRVESGSMLQSLA
ncbi:hypothetical protein Daus18300_008961 [Diaporthe australafricana]|uniref:Uncharacterized protein n=1 Tax=Diaporthe australafricana TaxID=127596 RepID=A0ABR3WGC7_9PEZI